MRTEELYLEGALIGDDLQYEENVVIELTSDGYIRNIYYSRNKINNSLLGIPALINSHIHTADYSILEIGNNLTLEELVAPPHGLKHKMLSTISSKEIQEARKEVIDYLYKSGACLLADFVEGGFLRAKEAKIHHKVIHLVLGRPAGEDKIKEAKMLYPIVEGLGLPDILSYTNEELELMYEIFKEKLRLIHISETKKLHEMGDFYKALEHFRPQAIIHGTHLDKEEIKEAVSNKVSIIVCARSNFWFSTGEPPISEMLNEGINVAIGTDNAGWIKPDLWREMDFIYLLLRSKLKGFRLAIEILKMATINGGKIFAIDPAIKKGNKARIILLDSYITGIKKAHDKYSAIIKRGGIEAIKEIII